LLLVRFWFRIPPKSKKRGGQLLASRLSFHYPVSGD
jgi:hypothetical protein